MLTDEQLGVLGVDKDKHLKYILEAQDYTQLEARHWIHRLAGDLATALLARQRDQERFDKLSSYAVHQPMCTTVLSVTNRCSCGLHGVLGVALRGEDAEWRDYKEMTDGKD